MKRGHCLCPPYFRQIVEPLTFGSLQNAHIGYTDKTGAYINVIFPLTNGGSSPALQANVVYKLNISPFDIRDKKVSKTTYAPSVLMD